MRRVAQAADTQKVFSGGSLLRRDELMLNSLPLLSGGIKQILLLFSVVFFQETHSKAIPLKYHTGQSSILQLWFKSPLQYRMRLDVCMSFLSFSR